MAAQAGLCLAWSETPEDTFSHGVAQMEFENGSLKARKEHDIVFWNEYEYMYHTSCCSGSVDLCNTAYSSLADLSVEYRIVFQISLKKTRTNLH